MILKVKTWTNHEDSFSTIRICNINFIWWSNHNQIVFGYLDHSKRHFWGFWMIHYDWYNCQIVHTIWFYHDMEYQVNPMHRTCEITKTLFVAILGIIHANHARKGANNHRCEIFESSKKCPKSLLRFIGIQTGQTDLQIYSVSKVKWPLLWKNRFFQVFHLVLVIFGFSRGVLTTFRSI